MLGGDQLPGDALGSGPIGSGPIGGAGSATETHTATVEDANPAQLDSATGTHQAPQAATATVEDTNPAQVDAATGTHETPLTHTATVEDANPAQVDAATGTHETAVVASVEDANPSQVDGATGTHIEPVPAGVAFAVRVESAWLTIPVRPDGIETLRPPRVGTESSRGYDQRLRLHRRSSRNRDTTIRVRTAFMPRSQADAIRAGIESPGLKLIDGLLLREQYTCAIRGVSIDQSERLDIVALSFEVLI